MDVEQLSYTTLSHSITFKTRLKNKVKRRCEKELLTDSFFRHFFKRLSLTWPRVLLLELMITMKKRSVLIEGRRIRKEKVIRRVREKLKKKRERERKKSSIHLPNNFLPILFYSSVNFVLTVWWLNIVYNFSIKEFVKSWPVNDYFEKWQETTKQKKVKGKLSHWKIWDEVGVSKGYYCFGK